MIFEKKKKGERVKGETGENFPQNMEIMNFETD